jgi:hypothetical protein
VAHRVGQGGTLHHAAGRCGRGDRSTYGYTPGRPTAGSCCSCATLYQCVDHWWSCMQAICRFEATRFDACLARRPFQHSYFLLLGTSMACKVQVTTVSRVEYMAALLPTATPHLPDRKRPVSVQNWATPGRIQKPYCHLILLTEPALLSVYPPLPPLLHSVACPLQHRSTHRCWVHVHAPALLV